MDWSRTKTIFIITFLILDLFLGYQFIEKRNNSQFDVISDSTIEEKLDADGITYGDLPKEATKAVYVGGESRVFEEEEIRRLTNQKIFISKGKQIVSSFRQDVLLKDITSSTQLMEDLKPYILDMNKYIFSNEDKKTNTLIFFQSYDGRAIYNNVSSMLRIHINAKKEAVSYEQTMLTHLEKYDEKQENLSAIKAIETLYDKSLLKSGDHITSVELGYYAPVDFTASQVLTPTWHVIISNKTDYYINAFEGKIINNENKVLE